MRYIGINVTDDLLLAFGIGRLYEQNPMKSTLSTTGNLRYMSS